jgi:D-alanyl-lipoteichoic acid acyltransferase DltB (MBOAT superfamily)
MLFNSFEFVLYFLPATLVAYHACRAGGRLRASVAVLAAASVFFYAWWDWRNLFILGASIVFNYAVGRRISERGPRARSWLVAGVAGDLVALGFFKYWGFFAGNVAWATGWQAPLLQVALPLGISFFTFTQIAFLVDAWRGSAREYRFVDYVLFVSYFPHLIAGPIIHHKQFMPQLARRFPPWKVADDLALGLAIFVLGLGKKVLLADNLSGVANAAFGAAAKGQPLDPVTAWAGVGAYTLQLYFDFSGYSDMAVGLSKMLGINLPINFNAPYRATSMIDFWRRWHMTLSRFLRDYLYIPLGGNRRGRARRYLNLLATMVLGGLWHGAGWTFVIWGAIHGLALAANHAWRETAPRAWYRVPAPLRSLLGWALTFSVVMLGWVYFRSHDVAAAHRLLSAMAGVSRETLHSFAGSAYSGLQVLATLGWRDLAFTLLGVAPMAADAWGIAANVRLAFAAPFLLALSIFGPTALALACGVRRAGASPRRAVRACAHAAVVLLAILSFACLGFMNNATEFLYFQF